jgi:Tol biopolymer transport system component
MRRLVEGSEPVWVRGGRRIAFAAPAKSPQSFSNRIATMRRDGGDVRVLLGDTKGYRQSLAVAPDGHRLMFVEMKSRLDFFRTVIRIIDVRTGPAKTIPWTKTKDVGAAAWMPGTNRISYFARSHAAGRRPPSSVYSIRPDGTGKELLLTLPHKEYRGLWGEALAWQPHNDFDALSGSLIPHSAAPRRVCAAVWCHSPL